MPLSALNMEAVAREAGVSLSTVSRALRNSPRISAETRRRIHEITERLGYRPNPMVSVLMTQLRAHKPPAATANLAWLDFGNDPTQWKQSPVSCAMYYGALERARTTGYSLERVHAKPGNYTPKRLSEILLSRGIHGLLLPFFPGGHGMASVLPFDLSHFALVSVGTRYVQPDLHFVSNDQYAATRMAVLQLCKLGYKRIAYASSPFIELVVSNRFAAGYLAAMQLECGLTPLPPFIDEPRNFNRWWREQQPEVVIAGRPQVVQWLQTNPDCPQGLPFATIDVHPGDETTTGVRQHSEMVGMASIDMLIGQINRNERGVPSSARGMLIEGSWVPGTTAVGPTQTSGRKSGAKTATV